MDELRKAVGALAANARALEAAMETAGDPPSQSQLRLLHSGIEHVQTALNRLQTSLDAWAEETQSV